MTLTIDDTQHKAARVVGFCYLFAMAAGVFGESYVRGKLIAYDNAAQTVRNILANEQLFRIGIAAEILSFVSDVALITALYVILEKVSRPLALYAAFLRLMATSISIGMTLTSLDVLQILNGAASRAFEADRLQALAMNSIVAHGAAFNTAFVFLGLGSTVFAWLWLRSRYIPRLLAGLGVLGSILLATGCFLIVLFPALYKALGLSFMMPLGLFEVSMGFLLLIKGLRR